jgi:hypothetical protein
VVDNLGLVGRNWWHASRLFALGIWVNAGEWNKRNYGWLTCNEVWELVVGTGRHAQMSAVFGSSLGCECEWKTHDEGMITVEH